VENRKSCYGKMYPSIVTAAPTRTDNGKVFSYEVDQPYVALSPRQETVNYEAWRECTGCPDFDTCFRLSVGTLLMEIGQKL
jgi:hypothetical protein